MFDSERALETSQLVAAEQQEKTVAQIRAGLTRAGAEECRDCGDEIEAARRAAMPSATRCVRCQGRFERRGK